MDKRQKLVMNAASWDYIAQRYKGVDSLPYWGPFGIGVDLKLIPKIKGLTFLEIGCGSGHSIQYLIKKGAKKVYGIDVSKSQIAFAADLNGKAVVEKRVELLLSPMEKRQPFKNLDIVFSVYGMGWSVDHEAALRNIFSYLKRGGRFIFSVDHKIFRCITEEGNKVIFKNSYHDELAEFIKDWKGTQGIHLKYLKTATWFSMLRKAGFVVDDYLEPKPKNKVAPSSSTTYTLRKSEMVPTTIIFSCRKP